MAWSEKLPSGKYRGGYRDAAGTKQYTKAAIHGTFDTPAAAERFAATLEHKERDGGRKRPSDAKTATIGDLLEGWKKWRAVEKNTVRGADSHWRNHVGPRWRDEIITNVTGPDIQVWVNEFAGKGLSARTASNMYFHLSSMLKYAEAKGYVDRNECKGVKLPEINKLRPKYLSDEAHNAIHQTLPPVDQEMLDLLDGTGTRIGEAMGVHIEHVDLRERSISLEWSYDPNHREMKELKSHQCRIVPISDRLAKTLEIRIERIGWGEPCQTISYKKRERELESGMLWRQPNGEPFSYAPFRKSLDASARIAFIGKGKQRRNVGNVHPHLWRHRYVKRLLLAGVPIDEVSRLLGHSSIEVTKSHYGDLAQMAWGGVRAALNADHNAPGFCPHCLRSDLSAAA
ncbi:tyrosine-type recombinase/integrase [Nocardia sp. CS682]|uniref:tyrosine-type recombinase/integrase n=1 Tax=Nocardia sp. CS682 TaxID=1047172 RepID=UPI001430E74A|nr:tyrosine-type recombinase/integrase [Nocardia sp. CS682]